MAIRKVTDEALEKALAALDDTVANSGDARKEALLQKALNGEISTEENNELQNLLAGLSPDGADLGKSATSGLHTDELRKSIEISPVLEDFRDAIAYGVKTLADEVQKGGAAQQTFNVVLAKALSEVGTTLKSIDARLQAIEEQPVSAPRAMRPTGPAGQAVQKSAQAAPRQMAGGQQQASARNYTESDVKKSLQELFHKSMKDGHDGMLGGANLQNEIARYEQTKTLSTQVASAVKQHLDAQASA